MYKILFTITLVLLLASCGSQQSDIYRPYEGNFNDDWEFIKDPNGTITPELFENDEKQVFNWQKISLPHTANIEPADSSGEQWQGIAWYRKFFTIPYKYKGKSLSLQFDAAMQVATIYLNDELIQTHSGGYLPFLVKLDGKISYGKQNCILIELDNRDNPLVPPGKQLAGLDFNYFSGIYRNVTLFIKDKLHISDPIAANRVAGGGLLVAFGKVDTDLAEIDVQTDIENENRTAGKVSLRYSLFSPAGKAILSKESDKQNVDASGYCRFKEHFLIKNPGLWSIESPLLYKLKVEVIRRGQPIDSVSQEIGIRTFSFSSKDGFILNGQKIKLFGTNRHQAYPYLGNALSDNAQYRDAVKIKQAGFNFVRCSHYPQSPSFLEACDKLGILVMDPVPGWQFIGNEVFQDNSISDVRQMVRRDRNHPSVILWEASLNETDMPKQFMERAHNAVHEELPFRGVYTSGWIDDIYDVFIPARQHADPPYYWNRYVKNKPFIIAEYGDWEYYAMNAGFDQTSFAGLRAEERSSRQLRGSGQKRLARQALNYQESHNDNLKGRAAGDANWLMFDYKRGYAPDIESSGIMDIFRIPKFAFYFYESQKENGEPMIYIANFWNDPSYREVKVYSNCGEVELSLNGKVISSQKPDKDMYSTNLVHPPFTFYVPEYKPGKLEAKGFIGGKEVVKAERRTPGKPSKIELSVDLSGKELQADRNDVVFVYASITDADGTVIPDDKRAVSYTVEGDATLVGDNPGKAEAGISTILLKAGITPGNIKVKAVSEGLIPGELTVNAKR